MGKRFRTLKKALESLGCTVEKPNSSSHWKVRKGSLMYVIPAHNGLKSEISDAYVRGVCRALKLDEAEFFALISN